MIIVKVQMPQFWKHANYKQKTQLGGEIHRALRGKCLATAQQAWGGPYSFQTKQGVLVN